MGQSRFPEKQGLYDPAFEHDSCGVGFVCDIKGRKSHDIIEKAIKVLEHMSHRGAVGADPATGDGAGILMQIPHEYYKKECAAFNIDLPGPGKYGTGIVFLPTKGEELSSCTEIFDRVIEEEGQELLGWRDMPVDDSAIGKGARATQPRIRQVFIASKTGKEDPLAFERKLYIIRKRVENEVRASTIEQKSYFYITNISARTVSYKGLLMPEQVRNFYPELSDEDVKSSLALVHSRYSTNTFPTWDLAQPFRFLAHNGEINTLRGNINWMKAREGLLESALFGDDIKKLKPVIVPGGSDSATLDNVLELLALSGRSLPHAMMMLVPGAWERDDRIDPELRDFYRFNACIMEPWDGPAALAVTDGTRIGAVLDRNGLRPARYIVTRDDMVVMASEMGVLDIDPATIACSGRLEPGKVFLIDTELGRIIQDKEVKNGISRGKPYGEWLRGNILELADVRRPQDAASDPSMDMDALTYLKAFGYTREDMKEIILPMAEEGKEPVGAMGNDAPHAVLSRIPQSIFNYFKQLFAQVTNPPIDPIREELVMSMTSYLGSQKNLLEETPEHCHKLILDRPVLTDDEMAKLRHINESGFKTRVISTLFDVRNAGDGFEKAIDRICAEAVRAVEDGYSFMILSDRGISKEKAAVPCLIAMGAVHHYLVAKKMRTRISTIVESAEPREVHHFALLFGYGAGSVNPYLAYKAIDKLIGEGLLGVERQQAIENYRDAVEKGILKILSKMGISTIKSYRGAQIFEALGIGEEVMDKCFCGTPSRIGGVGFRDIEKETLRMHSEAYPDNENLKTPYLSTGGFYQWKKDGEFHLWRPESIAALQDAVRTGDRGKYREFAQLINDQSGQPVTLRGVFKFKDTQKPISIDKVEPVPDILKRFATGAMSFGSISKGAHESLAIAMNRLGGRSNTGEGGEDPARFQPLPNGDSMRSAIKQVASGRFGVSTNYLVNADELQIKIAQGAKPGEGGQLPGHKVSAIIARTRYTTPGVTLISPPPHHDIYSIEDLAQLIFDLKNVNPRARISVKLVSEVGVGTIAAGVAKGHADMILISGGDGGTGASPRSSIRHAGLPWELGLSETHQTLVLNDLRSRVRLQTDGQIRTGRDVAVAALLGAEEYGFCTAALITLGCVMLRHCNLNNCSLGVATQDELLQRRFQGKPEYVENYMVFVVEELREIMARLGMSTVDEMIGRTDLLEVNRAILPEKSGGIDLSRILYQPKAPGDTGTYRVIEQDHKINEVLDRRLIEMAKEAVAKAEPVRIEMPIRNVNRTTGAMLSGNICSVYGERGLPEDTVHVKFNGVAGQSFGAFLAKGVTFELEGLANDYVGKGMSGGKVIIYPDRRTTYPAKENILIGNTTFYGAVSGEAYISGLAGERFCIRNSGLYAVVEGVGDHGCEYMTGGRVVILGRTGRNFAAGMSGGIAYVHDVSGDISTRCNMEMVTIEELDDKDRVLVRDLVRNHLKYTGSDIAKTILDDLPTHIAKFAKIMPVEYKKVLEASKGEGALGLLEVSDG
ncbi:MAG: glutamate synthase large subunit [Candidatus Omnitrophica bacterium]|nr:glutamate synthase large subunit [Candidatus Omnitrophota bacterium]MDD5487703.1 glutamate synthase large subunit [Candidatus Omnitrophota bacterium]